MPWRGDESIQDKLDRGDSSGMYAGAHAAPVYTGVNVTDAGTAASLGCVANSYSVLVSTP